jgi:hypothetical protein
MNRVIHIKFKHRNFRTFSIQSLAANSGCPWYVSNSVIRKDLQIPTVKEEIIRFSSFYAVRLRAHTNKLTATLTEQPIHKRLRRFQQIGTMINLLTTVLTKLK